MLHSQDLGSASFQPHHPLPDRWLRAYPVDRYVLKQPVVIDEGIITCWNPSTAIDVAFLLPELLTSKENTGHIKNIMGFDGKINTQYEHYKVHGTGGGKRWTSGPSDGASMMIRLQLSLTLNYDVTESGSDFILTSTRLIHADRSWSGNHWW